MTILHPGHLEEVTARARARFVQRGLAVFPSFERAARALSSAIAYWRGRASA